MSVEYYAKLERAHLLRLAQEANGSGALSRPTRTPKQRAIRPSLQWPLDSITGPAIIVNLRQDLLAANLLGRAMYSERWPRPTAPGPTVCQRVHASATWTTGCAASRPLGGGRSWRHGPVGREVPRGR